MNKIPIVFFGTGPVAAESLKLLLANFDVQAVVTKPKPAHHRGNFPVLDVATKNSLAVFTVSNKQELSDLIANKPFQTGLAILIDFGIIVGRDVIDYFPKGIVNSHFSLLPEWRGADPITFSILSGQKKTGVSLMLINESMDTGKLITSRVHQIEEHATTTQLTNQLILLSNQLLTEYLPGYLDGSLQPRSQPHPDRATYSRKLTKKDGVLDFNKPARILECEIRAFSEWPKSRTTLNGLDIVITKAHVENASGTPGSYKTDKYSLLVFCGDGKALALEEVKPVGKQAMSIQGFLAGYQNRL